MFYLSMLLEIIKIAMQRSCCLARFFKIPLRFEEFSIFYLFHYLLFSRL